MKSTKMSSPFQISLDTVTAFLCGSMKLLHLSAVVHCSNAWHIRNSKQCLLNKTLAQTHRQKRAGEQQILRPRARMGMQSQNERVRGEVDGENRRVRA